MVLLQTTLTYFLVNLFIFLLSLLEKYFEFSCIAARWFCLQQRNEHLTMNMQIMIVIEELRQMFS